MSKQVKAAFIAMGAVSYFFVLIFLIIQSGPSMLPNGTCCDDGISVAWGIGWMGFGLAFFVYKMAVLGVPK